MSSHTILTPGHVLVFNTCLYKSFEFCVIAKIKFESREIRDKHRFCEELEYGKWLYESSAQPDYLKYTTWIGALTPQYEEGINYSVYLK